MLPYGSFRVRVDLYGSLLVFIRPSSFLLVVLVLKRPYESLRVLIDPYAFLWVLMRPYVF